VNLKKIKCSPLTVLQAVELPAGVAHLAASLAHMDRDALPLQSLYLELEWRDGNILQLLVCQNQNKMAVVRHVTGMVRIT
jgi:hypothetical protein